MKELKKLIQVKKIIALCITFTLVGLACSGKVTSEQFLPLATMVIGYYFGQSTMKALNIIQQEKGA